MKPLIILCSLLLLTNTLIESQNCEDNYYCGTPGEAFEPEAPTDHTIDDGSDKASLAIINWQNQSSQFSDYKVIVTTPCKTITNAEGEDIDGEFIIGVSDDGVFDFSDDGNGMPYPNGTYHFTVFAYNQDELNAFANDLNPLLEIAYGVTIPCCPVDLATTFEVISTVLGVEPTIDDVEQVLCELAPSLSFELAYAISNPYSIDLRPVGINDLNTTIKQWEIKTNNEEKLIVEKTDANHTNAFLGIFDLTGKLLQQQSISTGNTYTEINIQHLPQGIYILQVNNLTTKHTQSFKFFKQ